MYYHSAPQTDVEDIIMDFLIYRKNKRHPDLKIQSTNESEDSQGEYKPLEIIHEYLSNEDIIYKTESCAKEPTEINTCFAEAPAVEIHFEPIAESSYEGVPDSEAEYMSLHYTDSNKRLYPYVDKVVCEYENTADTAFGEYVDKETIKEMVDKTLELASKDIYEINDIRIEMHRHPWSPYRILRACIESLLLNELYYKRKLMFTSVPDFSDKYRFI